MKRILSLLLCLSVVLSCCSMGLEVFALENEQDTSAAGQENATTCEEDETDYPEDVEVVETEDFEEYSSAVSELVREQMEDEDFDVEESMKSEFYSKRLIVFSEHLDELSFEDYNAVSVIVKYSLEMAVVQFADEKSTEKCFNDLQKNDKVEIVEVDALVQVESNDSFGADGDFSDAFKLKKTDSSGNFTLSDSSTQEEITPDENGHYSWGVEAMHTDMFAEYLQDNGYNNSVTVAVIDSGVDVNHPFLQGHLRDDGYNFYSNSDDLTDGTGHGTHVAGTIIDCVSGCDVKILPVKAFSASGTSSESVILNAIDYCIQKNVDVCNMSFSSLSYKLQTNEITERAVKNAIKNGIVCCVSAGNDSGDINKLLIGDAYVESRFYNIAPGTPSKGLVDGVDNNNLNPIWTRWVCPANIENAFVVGAIYPDGKRAYFSNYGDTVDYCAPGVDIASSVPKGKYQKMDGTSMAAPHISAAVALVKIYHPEYSIVQIENFLDSICTDYGKDGYDLGTGAGMPNFQNFFEHECVESTDTRPVISSDGVYSCVDCTYCTLCGKKMNEQTCTELEKQKFYGLCDLEEVTIPNNITEIGPRTFLGCANLRSLTIPDSVTVIDDAAFAFCERIKTLNIPSHLQKIGLQSFWYCLRLQINVYFPETFSEIGAGCFYGCCYIEGASFENASLITDIPAYCFYRCQSLSSLILPAGLKSVGYAAFFYANIQDETFFSNLPNTLETVDDAGFCFSVKVRSSLVMPDSVKSVGNFAFDQNEITEMVLSKNLETVGSDAFANNHGPEELRLPSSITSMGIFVFSFCDETQRVYWPESLTKIPDYAFSGNHALKEVVMPDTLTEIGFCSFASCYSFERIYIPDSVTKIGKGAFSSSTLKKNDFHLSENLTEIPDYAFQDFNRGRMGEVGTFVDIEIPQSVEKIGKEAFSGFYRIKSLTLHNSLKTVAKDAFKLKSYSNQNIYFDGTFEEYCDIDFENEYSNPTNYCGKLHINGNLVTGEFMIPEGITQLPKGAFSNTSITSISLPSTLEKIGENAFYNCTSLESIYIDTQEHFFNIEFGNGYSNPVMYSSNIVFGDGSEFSGEFIFPEGTEAISDYIFYNNTSFERIVIPSSVKTIGSHAFYGCTAEITTDFTSDELTIGDYAFYGCTGITHFSSAGDVLSIGDYAFYGCENFESFISQGSINQVGNNAFNKLSNLTTFSAANGGMRVGNNAFSECSNLSQAGFGDGLISVGEFAFYQCEKLKNISFSSDVESFGAHAFYNDAFNRIDIADLSKYLKVEYSYDEKLYEKVRLYGNNFPHVYDSTSIYVDGEYLTDLVIPEGITQIPSYFFMNWKQITSVYLPSTLQSIKRYAFEYCSNIQSVYAPSLYDWMQIDFDSMRETNPMWDSSYFLTDPETGEEVIDPETGEEIYIEVEKTLYIDGEPLTEVRIPEGITQIKDYTFNEVKTITDFYYPETVISISKNAFNHSKIQRLWLPDVNTWIGYTENNTDGVGVINFRAENIYFDGEQITELVVPDGVEKIGAGSFAEVRTLQRVYLPDSVTSIGEYAFSDCSNVTSFRLSNNITTLPKFALDHCPIENLYIPAKLTSCGHSAIYGAKKVSFAPRRTIEAKMFYYCGFEEIELPSALYYIREQAFCRNFLLKKVIIPNKVKTIESNAFEMCIKLEEATIPKSVTSIGDNVFKNCSVFADVYYPGTQAEWNNISIGANADLTGKVHFGANCMVTGHNVHSEFTVQYATLTSNGEKFKQCSVCTKHIDSVVLEKPVITLSDNASIVFDNENMLIKDFPTATDSVENLFSCSNAEVTCTQTSGGFGTGTQVTFTKDGEVVSVFTITVPGDVTGDGYIDAFDVAIASEIINTFEDPENPAYFAAMDMFSDGYIDAIDLAYINYIANFEE